MQPFTKLKVWRKAHELSLLIYCSTEGMPLSERLALASQMRRAAISIQSNIAEGAGRSTRTDFRRFLYIAVSSAAELQCQLLLARDLRLLSPDPAAALLCMTEEVKRMLVGLIKRLGQQ